MPKAVAFIIEGKKLRLSKKLLNEEKKMKRKIYLVLILLVLGLSATANAQKKGTLFRGVDWKKAVEAARSGRAKVDKDALARIGEAFSEKKEEAVSLFNLPLAGTWYITVPGATPAEDFNAYQTFGADGTFVETSSILVTLTEGPAHGVWEARRGGYVLTFELFAFDPEEKVRVGRIRVRAFIRLPGSNSFIADAAVDFIELDGTIIPNIGTGSFYGERVTIKGS